MDKASAFLTAVLSLLALTGVGAANPAPRPAPGSAPRPAPVKALVIRRFEIPTPDRVLISASYFPTTGSPAPAVLLVPSLGGTREEWQPFAHHLQTNGITALVIELRGQGASTRRITDRGPVTLDYHQFGPADYQDMLLDINSAVDWLAHQEGVDPARLALVGSDLSANLALRYALVNEDLAALVLLSPGLVYKEVRTDDAVGQLGSVPVRVLVCQADGFAFESCRRLQSIRRKAKLDDVGFELTVYPGNHHGSDILRGARGAAADLLRWLQQTLGRAAAPEPAATAPAAP